jgi:hypothetical protein
MPIFIQNFIYAILGSVVLLSLHILIPHPSGCNYNFIKLNKASKFEKWAGGL